MIDYNSYAVASGEGLLTNNGTLCIETGKRTGRSPKARYIVKDELTSESVAWGNINQPISPEKFDDFWERAEQSETKLHEQNLVLGHDSQYSININAKTELAAHALFLKNMFIEASFNIKRPCWQLVSIPSLTFNPEQEGLQEDGLVIINFSKQKVLICGMRYSGEMKKAMFSVLNYILTFEDVLPMHCAASADANGNSALYFGLSGTGKTTLSADPDRLLIGDDEHGWSSNGIFNFEGGCYAKCIDLKQEYEPIIWQAIRPGALLENVVLDHEKKPDYSDTSKTKNTRVAYPLAFVPNRVESAQAKHPATVIFLTCDLFGVLPPVSVLGLEQSAYYFLSGYTALVGSTEMGSSSDIAPTFSTCFGAPFFARPAEVYVDLLRKRLQETNAQVLLVNTGWYGGKYGSENSSRYPISVTRSIINSALANRISESDCWQLPGFELLVPNNLSGVDNKWLDPRNSWADLTEYQHNSLLLQQAFVDNMAQMQVSQAIIDLGPKVV